MSSTPNIPGQLFDTELLKSRRERFSLIAPDFLDDYVGDEFVERFALIKRNFVTGLFVGAPPKLSETLKANGTVSNPVCMDSSRNRLADCQHAALVGDVEALAFGREKLDCIVSALNLHFVNDLPGALIQMRRALKPDGLFVAAMLGGETFHELRQCFLQADSELSAGVAPRIAPFTDIRDAGALLQRAGFALPVADSDIVTVRYSSILDLMHDLRHLGWANALHERPRTMMRKDVLARASALYNERFADLDGRLRATFQIIWLTGWSPHESQQKPLKPGSAKMRLADALGTEEFVLQGNEKTKDTR